ncbi:MAG TPA: acyl-CoA thioesterase [Longimicrobiales bacterium]|nr:acyl-CoA thioesterase [Longimicrobiales bacterium]
MAEALAAFPIVIEVPVAWGEMDAFGHVNNIVYFRYFESARIAYLDAIEFRGDESAGGAGPILASTHCRFRKPLAYPATVRVGARTSDVAADRFTMEYRIVDAGGDVVAEGGGVVVAYDYVNAGKTNLPVAVRARIEHIEKSTNAQEVT